MLTKINTHIIKAANDRASSYNEVKRIAAVPAAVELGPIV